MTFIASEHADQHKRKPAYITDSNPRPAFMDEMRSYGFEVPPVPVLGKLERVKAPDEKKGKKSGWYFYNEIPDEYQPGAYIGIGVFGNWRGVPEKVVWTSKRRDAMSTAELARFEEQLEAEKMARDEELNQRRAAAEKRANAIWAEATEAPEQHPYFTTKQIGPNGAKANRGQLLVPVLDKGEIVSLQFIGPDGTKRFLSGGKTKGCYHLLKGDSKVVFTVEGFATGATTNESTSVTTFVAFNAGNLIATALEAKRQYPDALHVIAGDDDKWTEGNPGRKKAEAAAEAIGGVAVFPKFANLNDKPTDFNDLHCLEGMDEVRAQLEAAIEAAAPPTFDECMDAATALNQDSAPDEIDDVLSKIMRLKPNAIAQRKLLVALKTASGIPMGDLNAGLKEKRLENQNGEMEDLAYGLVKKMLVDQFNDGAHLIRGIDQRFWVFSKTHWRAENDEFVKGLILKAVDADQSCVPGEAGYATVVQNVFNLLVAKQAEFADKLRIHDDPPPVINCQNGELWLGDDGAVELRSHRFDSYLTSVLNFEYAPLRQSPKFDQAMLGIFQDASDPADMVRHYQEFMGYAIQPQRHIPAIFMKLGKGRNGKTILMKTIERLVSIDAIHAGRIGDFEKNRFAIGSLPDKLLIVDDDVDTGTKLPDGFLKAISERKTLTGEIKHKNSFQFIATCLPVLLANNPPYTADLTLGIRRRMHIIPFKHVFTDADADNKLFPYIWEHEMSGVLNGAIEGLRRVLARGKFDEPKDCLDAKKIWINAANPVSAFLDECCRDEQNSHVAITPLYEAFQKWAEECGIKNIPSRNTMKSNIEGLGYTVQRITSGNAVYGIELIRSNFGYS